jgi:Fur family ferric uptake transcriptional regulator
MNPLLEWKVMSTPTLQNRRDLEAAGLRVTAQRMAVLATLRAGRVHVTADQMIDEVGAQLGTVSTQAVYDALASLCDAGLARRVQLAKHAALFEARVADNHHHAVCRSCGLVVDVDCANLPAPCLDPSGAEGFAIDEAEVTFWGTCPTCIDVEASLA